MKEVLVLGGSGFIGRNLAKRSQKNGFKTFVLSMTEPKNANKLDPIIDTTTDRAGLLIEKVRFGAMNPKAMDDFINELKKLGANFKVENGYVVGQVNNQLIGSNIKLSFPSVGATENIMMAAVKAKGKTIIENAAKEPEIIDLANSLNKMGANVKITNKGIINITGVKKLNEANTIVGQ